MTVNVTERPPLPDAWRWARLGEACRVFTGGPAPQGQQYFAADGPFFFRVRDLGNHRRTMDLSESQDKLSPVALKDAKLVPVRAGAVLFPKSGAAIATNNRALLTADGYIVSHLMALEPKAQITSEWIYHLLCRVNMMDYADNTGYPSLKKSVVERIEIPLPPLEEQRRIVARLDERMAVAERARLAADRIAEAANALKISLLREILP